MIDWLRRAKLDGATEPHIGLCGQEIPIVLKRHKQAKRLTLRLAPDGSEVRLTLPYWARSVEAIAFAHARHDWLEAQMAKLPKQEHFSPNSQIQYRGERIGIDWSPRNPRLASLDGGQLIAGGPERGLERRVKSWLEKRALELFEHDMRDYCSAADLAPVPVALSRAQKRWGSCSEKSRIRLNWRLVQAPDFVRRSVVAHEVTHLVHFDHSPAFHALLASLYEGEIAEADAWLKQNGRSLYAQFG